MMWFYSLSWLRATEMEIGATLQERTYFHCTWQLSRKFLDLIHRAEKQKCANWRKTSGNHRCLTSLFSVLDKVLQFEMTTT